VPEPDWTQEGAYRVSPGVHRIPLPLPGDGLRAVNVYAVEAVGGLVLIDSGWALAAARGQLERSLAALGAGLGDVRRFLVTHLHRDHYTQALAIREALGTPVALGAEERHSLDAVLRRGYRGMSAQLRLLRASGAERLAAEMQDAIAGFRRRGGEGEGAGPFADPDEWITSGASFDLGTRVLEAIATPGHTRGHVVFTDRQAGLLFAGDHVLPHITPSIGFEACPPDLPLGDYLESLNIVRRLPDLRLLPAHGPVTSSAHARIDELIAHHSRRLSAMAAVLDGRGPLTAYQVAGAVPWTRRNRELTELDPFNQTLAVCETAFHLDLLAAQRAVTVEVADGVRRYAAAVPDAVT
jgi:glyoxylase-like metal-dependent hydrolase (beta-lactamase superfamily II)